MSAAARFAQLASRRARFVAHMFVMALVVLWAAACGSSDSPSQSPSNSGGKSLRISPSTATVAIGATTRLVAELVSADGTGSPAGANVVWASSDVTLAKVAGEADGSATVTGYAKGSITITSTFDGLSATAAIAVTAKTDAATIELVSIEVTPTAPSVPAGLTKALVATGVYSDKHTEDLTSKVTWSSSASSVATISDKGVATAVAAGEATITAKSGSVSGTTKLTVTNATLVSLAVTPTNPSIAAGTKQQFTATGTFTDATTQDMTATVTWASSTTSSATIGNDAGSKGLAIGVSAGTSTITATSGTVSATTKLTVTDAKLVSIEVTPTNPSIALGMKQQFTATGTYTDKTTQDLTATVTWASATPNTATVSDDAGSKGFATSAAVGTTKVSATFGGVTGSTTLNVTAATLVSIEVTPTKSSIALGTKQPFTATGTYTDKTVQDLTATVTWASSAPATATVSNAAGSKGLGTSVGIGTTTISATSDTVTGATTLEVTAAELVSIEVTPTKQSIADGTTQPFTATGTFTDGSVQDLTASVTWASSSTAAAVVSNAAGSKGLATGLGVGTTTISATSGTVSGSTELTVTPAALVAIEVTPKESSIPLGKTQNFVAKGTFTNGTEQDLTTTVTWASSSTDTATVSNADGSRGLATSVGIGTTTISATSGDVTGSTTLNVTAAELVSIDVTPANSSIALGTIQPFAASGTFTDGSSLDLTASVTWASSSTVTATVSNAAGSKGQATSIGIGTTTISATLGAVTGTTTLDVTGAKLVSIEVTPAATSISAGKTQQFVATGTYTDGTEQDLTSTVTWASSSTAAATVSNAVGSRGLATGVAIGTTTISATSGTVVGSTTLGVTVPVLVSIMLSPATPTIGVGMTQQFTATGVYSDATQVDVSATVTWSSSTTGVATISNATGTKGLATGVTAGTTTITATSGTVSGTATLTVSNCSVTINEVATQGPLGADDEFVELYNGCPFSINLTGWKLAYRSAANNNDVTLFNFIASTELSSGGFMLYVGSKYAATAFDAKMSSSIAATGGGVGLKDTSGTVRDSVGWGTATNAFVEGTATAAPTTSQSISRFPADGTDTNKNSVDFHTTSWTPRAPNL